MVLRYAGQEESLSENLQVGWALNTNNQLTGTMVLIAEHETLITGHEALITGH